MKHHLPVSILPVLSLLVGCPPGDTCEGLDVNVDEVTIGQVGVDQTRSVSVVVSRDCDAPTTVNATVDGAGFSVDPASLGVQGEGALQVSFTAPAEGPATGTLTLSSGDDTVSVSITAEGIPWLDEDGDGFSSTLVGGDDCDDSDPDTYPGATEVWYDGTDQDCAGDDDFDQDGDGSAVPEDCDDQDPDVRPGIDDGEDGEDSDCDGLVDEGPLGVDDLLITEVMHSPLAVGDDVGEWIELHNLGDRALPLLGYRVADDNGEGGFTIDRATTVPAGGFAVLGADGRASNNGGAPVDFVYDRDTLRLLAESGGVTLLGRGDRVISRVAWSEGWPAERGASLQVDPVATLEDDLSERGLWCLGTESMAGGDLGTPGAANTACPRFDADEDGFAIQDGDCDDDDPDINPDATEVWGDGLDNDCSGLADEGELASLRSSRIVGRSAPTTDALGYPDDLSVADLDGDGTLEVLLGARFGSGYAGAVYVIDADDMLTSSGAADALAIITFEGGSATNQLGSLATFAGDVTGDGIADLVIGGTDARDEGDLAAVVLAGGSALSGRVGPPDAVLSLTGSVSTTGGDVHGGLDLDGDGLAELIHGDVAFDSSAGRVTLVEGGTTGSVAVSEASRRWTGSARQDQAGASLGGADLNDDGYDDLLVSAWASDPLARNGGALYLIAGGRTLPADGTLSQRAQVTLAGDRDGARLGEGAAARVADFDQDGTLDVLVGAPMANRAFVWLDAGSLSGTSATSTADHELVGPGVPDSFGVGLAAADVDGDGRPEAIIGAADDLTSTTGLSTAPGEVYVFDLGGAPRRLGPPDARAIIRGAVAGDAVGQSLLGVDLDGDGQDELLIGAIGDAGGAGSVSLLRFP